MPSATAESHGLGHGPPFRLDWFKRRMSLPAGFLPWRRHSTGSSQATFTPATSGRRPAKEDDDEARPSRTCMPTSQLCLSRRTRSKTDDREALAAHEEVLPAQRPRYLEEPRATWEVPPAGTRRGGFREERQQAPIVIAGHETKPRATSGRRPMLPLTPRPVPRLKELGTSPLWARRQQARYHSIWDPDSDVVQIMAKRRSMSSASSASSCREAAPSWSVTPSSAGPVSGSATPSTVASRSALASKVAESGKALEPRRRAA